MTGLNTKDGVNHGRDADSGPAAVRMVELTRLLDAVPPHALEAEMSLLGAMLFDPRMIADVVTLVKSGRDFHNPAHGVLFRRDGWSLRPNRGAGHGATESGAHRQGAAR